MAAKGGVFTPDGRRAAGDENDDGWAAVTGQDSMTPMKRVPLLANFEEWMKMATDNKINATNSWNFALIDYFHDMSLLKEGDSVNFQKASCTLDGCVKIYTSRVDSVATETGKLLSGLADSRNQNKKGGDEEGEGEGEDDEEGEDGEGRKKPKRKAHRSEATLATSFAQLQLKKFELEFAVDPLFKKASADFDEGGAKGLLLNHLCIDGNGRIVFDSSDDLDEAGDGPAAIPTDSQEERDVQGEIEEASIVEDDLAEDEVELEDLAAKFFPDMALLDEQDICPSLKNLDLGETMDLASLPMLQDQKSKDEKKEDTAINDDDAGLFALGDDGADEPGFGMGGDAWAQQAGLEPTYGMPVDGAASGEAQGEGEEGAYDEDTSFSVKMQFGAKDNGHADILGYFDNTLKSNWAGPEHWRIKKMKQDTGPREVTKRKPKEPFEIDFQSALPTKLAEQIYTTATSNSAISLPKAQWRSRTRHLLPDDKHFNSTSLLRLYLKPKARIGRRGTRRPLRNAPLDGDPRHVDDAYWAQAQEATVEAPKNEYDADFFQEDDAFGMGMLGGDDEFEDARETFTPAFREGEQATGEEEAAIDPNAPTALGPYGSSLVTQSRRLRPEYVSYAKVAKKVDVRLLKEKMWKGIGFNDVSIYLGLIDGSHGTKLETEANLFTQIIEQSQSAEPEKTPETGTELQFTSVMNDLQSAYSAEAMADISTSYCFISLLHLANEKGLILGNERGLEDLSIRRDLTADVSAAA